MAIDQWTGAARGVGAYSVFVSPVLVAAATAFLDRPAD